MIAATGNEDSRLGTRLNNDSAKVESKQTETNMDIAKSNGDLGGRCN